MLKMTASKIHLLIIYYKHQLLRKNSLNMDAHYTIRICKLSNIATYYWSANLFRCSQLHNSHNKKSLCPPVSNTYKGVLLHIYSYLTYQKNPLDDFPSKGFFINRNNNTFYVFLIRLFFVITLTAFRKQT